MYCSTEERAQIAIIEREIRKKYANCEEVPQKVSYTFSNRWMYPTVRKYFERQGVNVTKYSEKCWNLEATAQSIKLVIDFSHIR